MTTQTQTNPDPTPGDQPIHELTGDRGIDSSPGARDTPEPREVIGTDPPPSDERTPLLDPANPPKASSI